MLQIFQFVLLCIFVSPASTAAFNTTFSTYSDKFQLCNTHNLYQDPKNCLIVSSYLTTWKNAQNFCKYFGGDLLPIENQEQDELITEVIQTMNDSSNGFWIGLNDLQEPGIFEWSTGILLNYTHWKTNMAIWDPLNDTGSCVSIDSGGGWSINNCSAEKGFICLETPLSFNPSGCGHGMVRFRNSCYWTVNGWEGWDSASNWCRTEGGELVDVEDDLENAFLYHFLLKSEKVFWIGLHKTDDHPFPTWAQGNKSVYTNWDKSPNLSSELCAVIERRGKWMMQPCASEFSWAVCKKSMSSTITVASNMPTDIDHIGKCSDEWMELRDHCYMTEKSNLFSWNDALAFCLSIGGNLASFQTTQDEHDLFINHSGPSDMDITNFWIGLKCNSSSVMEWTDGSPLLYAQWDPVQIANVMEGAEELCIAHSTHTDRWFCLPCETHAGFACVMPITARKDVPALSTVDDSTTETSKLIQPSTGLWNGGDCNGTVDGNLCIQLSDEDDRQLPTTLTAVDPCPQAWDKLGNKCYKVQHEELKDWFSARRDCLRFGHSDLVAVHSSTEEDFLLEILSMREVNNAWIGLNDLVTKGIYTWIDKSNFDYMNLALSNSEDTTDQNWKDCVQITNNKWQLEECDKKLPYICQKGAFTTSVNEDISQTTLLNSDESASNEFTSKATDFEIQVEPFSNSSVLKTIQQLGNNTSVYDMPQEIIPSLASFSPDTTDNDLTRCKCDLIDAGMSGGTIAGIVLGTLIITALIIGALLYVYRKNLTFELMKGKLSFDNALYNPNGDHIQLREPGEISVRT